MVRGRWRYSIGDVVRLWAARLATVLVCSLALVHDPSPLRGPVLAAFSADQSGLRIVSPAEGAVVGDGNLVLIEAVAVDRPDGVVDRVEVSFDGQDHWALAQRASEDTTVWRYIWDAPQPGLHELRARAVGLENRPPVEQTLAFRVADVWSTPFVLDYTYARAGAFWKGQLHTHSTFSFDGWESLHPVDLAQEYRRRGYHFLAITDHDVIAYPQEVNDGSFRVIPAYESTSQSGHITGLFVEEVAPVELPPQQRIDQIRVGGGMAMLNHPSWQVGWNGTDFRTLEGCFAFEIFNYVTRGPGRLARNVALRHEVLNAKGPRSRIWAVAVDDAHNLDAIDHGWIMLKSPQLSEAAIRHALETGAFYASNGPSFSVLGVMGGAITASSPDASALRFIDQDNRLLYEGPGNWAGYFPTGGERWIRVEAVMADERTAWSQPFWVLPSSGPAPVVASEPAAPFVGEILSWAMAPFLASSSRNRSTLSTTRLQREVERQQL